jgi:hypothetical protein
VGLVGGGIGLVLISLISALTAPIPTISPTPPDIPNLRVSLDENFINRFIDQPEGGSVQVDVLPGNQFQVIVDTTVELAGSTLPIQITGLFQVQIIGDRLEVLIVNTQVAGAASPLELSDFFNEDMAIINQNLGMIVNDMRQALDVSAISLQVRTNDTQIQLEIKEVQ